MNFLIREFSPSAWRIRVREKGGGKDKRNSSILFDSRIVDGELEICPPLVYSTRK